MNKVTRVIDVIHTLTGLCNDKGLANVPVVLQTENENIFETCFNIEI